MRRMRVGLPSRRYQSSRPRFSSSDGSTALTPQNCSVNAKSIAVFCFGGSRSRRTTSSGRAQRGSPARRRACRARGGRGREQVPVELFAAGAEARELLALRDLEGVERREGLELDQLRGGLAARVLRDGEVDDGEDRELVGAGDVEVRRHGGERAMKRLGRRELAEDVERGRDHLVAQLGRKEEGRFREVGTGSPSRRARRGGACRRGTSRRSRRRCRRGAGRGSCGTDAIAPLGSASGAVGAALAAARATLGIRGDCCPGGDKPRPYGTDDMPFVPLSDGSEPPATHPGTRRRKLPPSCLVAASGHSCFSCAPRPPNPSPPSRNARARSSSRSPSPFSARTARPLAGLGAGDFRALRRREEAGDQRGRRELGPLSEARPSDRPQTVRARVHPHLGPPPLAPSCSTCPTRAAPGCLRARGRRPAIS